MTTKPKTDKQTDSWPTVLFETVYFRFEKRSLGQIQTQNFCLSSDFRFLQVMLARNAKKFEFIMNQYTSDSVKQVVNPKSLYSGLITLSNRKRKD